MATIAAASAASADIQAAIDAASNGDTVTVPAGTVTWTAGITCAKAITIQGAGAGRCEGSSVSSLAIGTGAKVFAITSGTTVSASGFTAGETIRAVYKADGAKYMEGTVTSYSGGNLTIEVTATGGAGTLAAWNFVVTDASQVTVTLNVAAGATAITLTESTANPMYFSGIYLKTGTGTGRVIDVVRTTNGRPVVIHNTRFTGQVASKIRFISHNRGLVYRCYFDTGFIFGATDNVPGYGITVKEEGATPAAESWGAASTMGTNDSNGEKNVYVESNYFAGFLTECHDSDDNSRLCWRNNVMDCSGGATHGADTSNYGNRHFQIYDNKYIFHDLGTETPNINYYLFLRGGTGVFTDNEIADITSSEWGNKPELNFIVENLRRNGGPHACWNSGYPAPRQVGFGYVTGAAGSDAFAYNGDVEPFYIWNNTGTGTETPTLADYAPDECAGGPAVGTYIQSGRDFVVASAKPGFTKYQFPHPLRGPQAPFLMALA